MLQQKLFLYGQCLRRGHSHEHVALVSRRLVSHDQHDSPTVPHNAHSSPALILTDQLPASCQVLIAGGGIIGQSIAYHLSEIGVKDIVLIEKSK